MTHAIRIHLIGGPEVLQWQAVEVGKPAANEIRIRHGAVGLNHIDTYHRSSACPIDTPAIPGLEAAGMVEEIGANVTDLKIGDRVAYASPLLGAY